MSKGDRTRQVVLAQATDVAMRYGLAGLTIGALADRVEMSKSGLFGHFRSKQALQLQILGYARECFVEAVMAPALSAPRGEKRVRTLVDRWLECGLSRAPGCLYVSAETEFLDRPGPIRDQLVADHRDLLDSIAQIFRTGVTEGEFRPDADAEQFAHDLYAVMLGFAQAHRLMADPAAERRARFAVDALLRDAHT